MIFFAVVGISSLVEMDFRVDKLVRSAVTSFKKIKE